MNQKATDTEPVFTKYTVVIYFLVLVVPLLVLPQVLDNAFNTPKNLLIISGVSLMLGFYASRFLSGKQIRLFRTSTPKILLFLVLLNLFSLFYTLNYYYTVVAASLNIACLVFFYFVALSTNNRRAEIILSIAAVSGLLVSLITWLQYFNIFVLFKWAHKGINVMGTIGNSNYLGAYLVFPLFCVVAMIFLMKGKWRLIPLICFVFMVFAFLFSRARASWMGFFLILPLFLLFMLRIHGFSVPGYIRANPRKIIVSVVVLLGISLSLWFAAPERLHRMMQPRNIFRSDTLILRMKKYYPSSFRLFKQSPLFGTGLWSYRNMVYEAQAQINEREKDFFKNYPEPKPRRVHTDYLEILNDGGIVAAAALSLFLILVLRHGWFVIRNDELEIHGRIVAAAAFCSVVAMLLATFFFFPFRINSTLFMTALMTGLMEGLYVWNHDLITKRTGVKSDSGIFLAALMILFLVGIVWYTGLKPFLAEREHFFYKQALNRKKPMEAEKHIRKAITLDPHNSAYCLYASQLYMNILRDFGKANDFIERAIIDYNGDLTRWSLYYIKGLLKFQTGSLFEARAAFQKSLYYNPEFKPAQGKLGEVEKVIKNHDRVMIKFK